MLWNLHFKRLQNQDSFSDSPITITRSRNQLTDVCVETLITHQSAVKMLSIKLRLAGASSANINSAAPPRKTNSLFFHSLTMRLSLALSFLAISGVAGFANVPNKPSGCWGYNSVVLKSTVEADTAVEETVESSPSEIEPVSPAEYNSRLEAQLEKLKAKDGASKSLSKEVSVTTCDISFVDVPSLTVDFLSLSLFFYTSLSRSDRISRLCLRMTTLLLSTSLPGF